MAELLTAGGAGRPPIVAATLELTQVDVLRYDLREAVRRLAAQGVNAVVVFGIGYLGGEAYYPSAIAPPHPALGSRDFLQEACEVTAELGIACIGYVNSMFGGPDAYGPHPDWQQARSDGTPTVMAEARALCPNSPYGERIVGLVEEIAERYPLQGLYLDEPSFQSWCACTFCRAEFEEATASTLPLVSDWSSSSWLAFLSWRHQSIASFVARCATAFKRRRPEGTFYCQHAFPMASTAIPFMRRRFNRVMPDRVPADVEGWARPLFYGQSLERIEPHLDMLSAEVWRRFVDRPVWWPGAVSSYLRSVAGDRPVLAFLEYPNFPWSLQCLPADELAYLVADVRANGGDPWFPIYAPGESDESGWQVISETNGALGAPPAGAVPVAEIAVGYSAASANLASATDVEDAYFDGLLGTIDLLRRCQRAYRVVALDALAPERLHGVSHTVLVDARALSDAAVDALTEYVETGGSLVLVGRNATHDADGRARPASPLEELAGIHLPGDGAVTELGIAYVDLPERGTTAPVQGSVPRVVLPEGATVVGQVRAGYRMFEQPSAEGGAITVAARVRRGAGEVTWSGLNPGHLHRRFRTPAMSTLLAATLPERPRPGITVDAPPTVAAYFWSVPGGGWHVLLLNETGLEDTGEVIHVGPVLIRAKHSAGGAAPPRVRTRPAMPHQVERDGEDLVVRLEAVGVWAVVQIGGQE